MRGNIIKKRLMSFAFKKTPRISLGCSPIPNYVNGLLTRPCQHIITALSNLRKIQSQPAFTRKERNKSCLQSKMYTKTWHLDNKNFPQLAENTAIKLSAMTGECRVN